MTLPADRYLEPHQARERPPTAFESLLGDAIERAFRADDLADPTHPGIRVQSVAEQDVHGGLLGALRQREKAQVARRDRQADFDEGGVEDRRQRRGCV